MGAESIDKDRVQGDCSGNAGLFRPLSSIFQVFHGQGMFVFLLA